MPAVKNAKSGLGAVVAKSKVGKKRKEPLWKGPEDAGPLGGITFSSLSKFLVCRERFRIEMIEGLKPSHDFSPRIEYGNMWHVCEEAFANSGNPILENPVAQVPWLLALAQYTKKLAEKYPHSVDQIRHWYTLCKLQFPLYIKHWAKNPDVVQRTPISQEQVFNVPYNMPSGRTVYLRGKFDSVDLIKNGAGADVYLQENKSKSDIDQIAIERQLKFDLQTMLYLVALNRMLATNKGMTTAVGAQWIKSAAGVRYNVVKRPLSGGKGTIKRSEGTKGSKCPKCKEAKFIIEKGAGGVGCKVKCPKCNGAGRIGGKPPESEADFYNRVKAYIVAEPEVYFARFKVEVSEKDVETFERTCLRPILEQLCEWYELAAAPNCEEVGGIWSHRNHWRHPFGVYNVLNEGGSSDLDDYLTTGSEVGLRRVDKLFEELEEEA